MSEVIAETKENTLLDLTHYLRVLRFSGALENNDDLHLNEPGAIKTSAGLSLVRHITELGNALLFTEDDHIDRDQVMKLRLKGVVMEIRQHPLDPEKEQITLITVKGKITLN